MKDYQSLKVEKVLYMELALGDSPLVLCLCSKPALGWGRLSVWCKIHFDLRRSSFIVWLISSTILSFFFFLKEGFSVL